MSSPGYFYDSDEQAQNEAIRRRQAYAQALMGGDQLQGQNAGLANAGNKLLGAFLTKKLDKQQQDLAGASQTRYSNDLARLLGGSVPPHMDANNPGSPQGSSQLDPEGNPASSMQSPAQPQPQGPGSFAQRLAGTNNPFLMQQFAPTVAQGQLKQEDADRERQRLTQSLTGAGVPPGIDPATWQRLVATQPDVARNVQQSALEANARPHQNTPEEQFLAEAKAKGMSLLDAHKQWEQAGFKPTAAPTEDVGGGLSDEAKINAATRFNQTGVMPSFGMGKAARQDRLEVMNYAAKLASGKYTPEQLVQNIANYKANSSSLQQQTKQFNSIEQNANAAKNSANLALEAATKGGAGPLDSPVFNRWIQSGRAGLAGDQNVINLNNHLATFGEEYAKVMTGATGSAPATDSARAAAHARISSANSLPQLKSILSEMGREMGGRHYAARAQIEGIQNQLGGAQYQEPQGVQTAPQSSGQGAAPAKKTIRFEDLK